MEGLNNQVVDDVCTPPGPDTGSTSTDTVTYTLTTGILKEIVERKDESLRPILQLLGCKNVGSSTDKYRLAVSDGKFSYSMVVLNTKLNAEIMEGHLTPLSIFSMDEYKIFENGGRVVISISDISLLFTGDEVGRIFGTPVALKGSSDKQEANASTSHAIAITIPDPQPTEKFKFTTSSRSLSLSRQTDQPPELRRATASTSNNQSLSRIEPHTDLSIPQEHNSPHPLIQKRYAEESTMDARPGPAPKTPRLTTSDLVQAPLPTGVIPINDLHRFSGNCSVMARVLKKTEKKTMMSTRGAQGNNKPYSVFSLELFDGTCRIRLSGFNEAADNFSDMIMEKNVYTFRGVDVIECDPRFANKHGVELRFTKNTTVVENLGVNESFAKAEFQFITIENIMAQKRDAQVDVIGAIRKVGEHSTVKTRNGEVIKRIVTIVDPTLYEVDVTLWAKAAQEFNAPLGSVMAIQSARVSEFMGLTLVTSDMSIIHIEPDIPEAKAIRDWYQNAIEGNDTFKTLRAPKFIPTTTRPPLSSTIVGFKFSPVSELLSAMQSLGEEAKEFTTKVRIVGFPRRDNLLYKSCTQPMCNKKVVDHDISMYKCNKCEALSDQFKWKLLGQIEFGDISGSVVATCFEEHMKMMLNTSPETMGQHFTSDSGSYDKVLRDALFNEYIVKFRCKMETFNGITTAKTSVLDIAKIRYKDIAKSLLAELRETTTNDGQPELKHD